VSSACRGRGPCAATAALLVAALLAGCGGAARTTTSARAGAVAPAAGERASCPGKARLAVAARQAVGGGAGPLATEGGAIWVARPQAGEVIRVSATGTIVAHLGGTPISLEPGFGRLWVAERDGNRVVSLNEQTMRQESAASIPLPVSVVTGPLGVWALSIDTNSLYRLDPATGISAPPYDSPVASPVDMVPVGDELWVLGAQEEGLSPFNAGLERIVRAGFDLPGRSLSGLSAAGGTIWLGETAGRSLLRVDAATAAVQRLPAPDDIQVLATAAGACGLWVADGSGDVALVDPHTATPLAPPIHIGRSVADLAASGTGVWASDPLDGMLVHVEARSAAG
jgi:streptogramin lyase